MEFGDVREYLSGKGELDFCELVDEDCIEDEEDMDELLDGEEYEIGLVEHYAELIEESECECGSSLRNILYSILQECMSMGYENAQEEINENKVTNVHTSVHIDNINFPNVEDKNELMEAFKNLPELAMSRIKF